MATLVSVCTDDGLYGCGDMHLVGCLKGVWDIVVVQPDNSIPAMQKKKHQKKEHSNSSLCSFGSHESKELLLRRFGNCGGVKSQPLANANANRTLSSTIPLEARLMSYQMVQA
jgi:hypothetical protein